MVQSTAVENMQQQTVSANRRFLSVSLSADYDNCNNGGLREDLPLFHFLFLCVYILLLGEKRIRLQTRIEFKTL